MPRLNDKFENMTDAQLNRTIYMYICAAIFEICDEPFIAAMQSERAMFNLVFTQKGLLNPKVPGTLASAIDPFWKWFAMKPKMLQNVCTGHAQYTDDFIDLSLINGAGTLEDSIRDYLTQFKVCSKSLSDARQLYGIGLSKTEEENHFAVLMDLAHGLVTIAEPLSVTVTDLGFTGQGTDHWFLGANAAIAIKYFQDVSEYRISLWNAALQNRRHWSYEDISVWSKTIFVDFTMAGDLMGLCENACYKPIRANVFFEEGEFANPCIESCFLDPIYSVASNNDPKVDPLQTTDPIEQPGFLLGYMFAFMENFADPLWYVYCTGVWSEQELIIHGKYNIRLARINWGAFGPDDYYRIWATRHRMVEYINAKAPKETLCLITSNAEELRFENLENVYNTPSVQVKYAMSVIKRVQPLNTIHSAARLKGETDGTLLQNFSAIRENAESFLAKLAGVVNMKVVDKTSSVSTAKKEAGPIIQATEPAKIEDPKTKEDDA